MVRRYAEGRIPGGGPGLGHNHGQEGTTVEPNTRKDDPLDRLMGMTAGFEQAKVLLAGAELGVFDLLQEGKRTAREIAQELSGTVRGVEILLDALSAIGVLEKDGDTYANLPGYEPYLTEGPGCFLGALRHRNHVFRNWAFLEDRALGRPLPDRLRSRSILEDRRANESFIQAMYAFGRGNAPIVADAIDFSGVGTVADIGGGPGHYLAEVARRHPRLTPFLVDLPLTLSVARSILASSGVSDRIRFVEWDFYRVASPPELPPLDLVYISAVLHAESPEANSDLLRRLFPMVSSGGRLIIQENVVEPGRTAPLEAALFAVNMLAGTDGGRTYTEEEIRSWGEAAGFHFSTGRRLTRRSYLIEFRKS
jgi:predicted O-methyltransferase YrrM